MANLLRTRTYRIRQVAKPVVTHSGLLVSGTWIQVVIISGIPESGLPYIGGADDTQLFTLILMIIPSLAVDFNVSHVH